MPRQYRIRYYVEIGNFSPKKNEMVKVAGGFRSTNDFGYAEDLMIASISDRGSIMLVSTQGTPPPKEMLVRVKEMIEHYLEHHV